MEKLKGHSILIGKEPGNGRLLVAMRLNGQPKMAAVGSSGSVPGCVSRCKLGTNSNEDIAHCRIDVSKEGKLTIFNLKEANTTSVDGNEVISKVISEQSIVTLGCDNYPINVKGILDVAKKLVGTTPEPQKEPLSIKHLSTVWDQYEKSIEEIQLKQLKNGKRRMLPIIMGSIITLIGAVLGSKHPATLYITIPLMLISLLFWLKIYFEKDTSVEDRKHTTDKLIDDYVCPHCKHYLGAQPYKVVKQNKNCPWCKGGWICD